MLFYCNHSQIHQCMCLLLAAISIWASVCTGVVLMDRKHVQVCWFVSEQCPTYGGQSGRWERQCPLAQPPPPSSHRWLPIGCCCCSGRMLTWPIPREQPDWEGDQGRTCSWCTADWPGWLLLAAHQGPQKSGVCHCIAPQKLSELWLQPCLWTTGTHPFSAA